MKHLEIIQEICAEFESANKTYPGFNSAHEGFAVLKEEVDELWDEVRNDGKQRDPVRMHKEAVQVAAMALKFAVSLWSDWGRT